MMISPDVYDSEYLRGRSQEEILHQIRSLKCEISRLKRELEAVSLEPKAWILPSPLTQIKCNRDYLERAKLAYEAAGGQYEPTRAEKRDQAFNN